MVDRSHLHMMKIAPTLVPVFSTTTRTVLLPLKGALCGHHQGWCTRHFRRQLQHCLIWIITATYHIELHSCNITTYVRVFATNRRAI